MKKIVAKKWFEIIANVLFWALTAWMITSSFSIQEHNIELIDGREFVSIKRSGPIIILLLVVIAISLPMFYGNLWNILILKKEEKRAQIIFRSLLIFIVAALIYNLAYTISPLSNQLPLPPSLSWGTMIFYYVISGAYGIGKVWQHSEIQRRQLALEKKHAELSLLRSQLHPHFLFNTLNNLLAMVDQQNNPSLAKALDRLSGLLRYVVYDTAAGKVPVRKEIDFIANYAELQGLRFAKGEAGFNLAIAGEFDQQKIEPGIFIPFIENAFKHGVEPEKESAINVKFDLSDKDKIVFSATNPIQSKKPDSDRGGSGIQATKERLALVYPGRHMLNISQTDNYNVKLEIETNARNNR